MNFFAAPESQKLIAELKAAGLNFSSKFPLTTVTGSENEKRHRVATTTKQKVKVSVQSPSLTTTSQSLSPIATEYVGKTFVFTGRLKSMNRSVATEIVQTRLRGNVKSNLTSRIDFLVVGDVRGETDKQQKAKELGVAVLTEQQFLDIIEQAQSTDVPSPNTTSTNTKISSTLNSVTSSTPTTNSDPPTTTSTMKVKDDKCKGSIVLFMSCLF